jgi:hypothetical protein
MKEVKESAALPFARHAIASPVPCFLNLRYLLYLKKIKRPAEGRSLPAETNNG